MTYRECQDEPKCQIPIGQKLFRSKVIVQTYTYMSIPRWVSTVYATSKTAKSKGILEAAAVFGLTINKVG